MSTAQMGPSTGRVGTSPSCAVVGGYGAETALAWEVVY